MAAFIHKHAYVQAFEHKKSINGGCENARINPFVSTIPPFYWGSDEIASIIKSDFAVSFT